MNTIGILNCPPDILNTDNYNFLFNSIVEYSPKILLGIFFLFFGLRLIKKSISILDNFLKSRQIDESLRPFFKSLLSITLQVALIISVLSMVGVEMTSFLAILGAAGLAVGLALKDTLQNFAAGVMILFFKPFKVGDFIEYEGTQGTVKEIQIFNSILTTVDNRRVIIPNGILQTSLVTNYSSEDIRRVIWTFSIAYGDDFNKAKSLLLKWIKEDERILDDMEPMVVISELADSSVNIMVRVWVKSENFLNVKFDYNEKVYNEFPKNNLNIPFPQLDVNINK